MKALCSWTFFFSFFFQCVSPHIEDVSVIKLIRTDTFTFFFFPPLCGWTYARGFCWPSNLWGVSVALAGAMVPIEACSVDGMGGRCIIMNGTGCIQANRRSKTSMNAMCRPGLSLPHGPGLRSGLAMGRRSPPLTAGLGHTQLPGGQSCASLYETPPLCPPPAPRCMPPCQGLTHSLPIERRRTQIQRWGSALPQGLRSSQREVGLLWENSPQGPAEGGREAG